jgi:hypothetical protein
VSQSEQGTCQRENPPFFGEKENPAAQMVLGLPSGLRRFCAASFEKIVNF